MDRPLTPLPPLPASLRPTPTHPPTLLYLPTPHLRTSWAPTQCLATCPSSSLQVGSDQLLVPANILNRWYERLSNRLRKDPDFLTRQRDKV